MKTALFALLSAAALAQVDVNAFCSTRPLGLYCSPDSTFQKIECPSGKIFTCPKGDTEECQERGILKTSGFKGGIARCVPNLGNGTVAAFCSDKPQSGTYCFGDVDQNIYIQCPTGLIYKCADNPTADTKKCFQTGSRFATCELNNGGVGTGTPTPVCPGVTVTETVTKTLTKRLKKKTKTVTVSSCPATKPKLVTSTLLIATAASQTPIATSHVSTEFSTQFAVSTSTIFQVQTSTEVQESTTVQFQTSTPPAQQFTRTLVVVQTP